MPDSVKATSHPRRHIHSEAESSVGLGEVNELGVWLRTDDWDIGHHLEMSFLHHINRCRHSGRQLKREALREHSKLTLAHLRNGLARHGREGSVRMSEVVAHWQPGAVDLPDQVPVSVRIPILDLPYQAQGEEEGG